MERAAVLAAIFEVGVIPVIRTHDAESAFRCVEALQRGGIYTAEIATTNPEAVQALERITSTFGDKVVAGAGTVLDAETARACLLAGAKFFLSPALRLPVMELAKEHAIVVMPGALTPNEVLAAHDAGADVVRIVPCDAVGGARYIKSLRAPFPRIRFLASGGVTLENIGDFLQAGVFAVGVTGALIDSVAVREGHYEVFTERARRFRVAIERARARMGSHAPNWSEMHPA